MISESWMAMLYTSLVFCAVNPPVTSEYLNSLRPRQNGRNFANDTFKCIFLNGKVWISIKSSLKFVHKGPMNNIPALVQIMAWRWPGDKPLSEPMMVRLPMHKCVTRPQWVNKGLVMQNLVIALLFVWLWYAFQQRVIFMVICDICTLLWHHCFADTQTNWIWQQPYGTLTWNHCHSASINPIVEKYLTYGLGNIEIDLRYTWERTFRKVLFPVCLVKVFRIDTLLCFL